MTICLAGLLAMHIPLASETTHQKCHLTYTAPLSSLPCPELTLLEAYSVLASSGTTGLRTWEAALCLGTFLFSPSGRHLIHGKTILELGAGTGFLSILCAKFLGARFVLATDGNVDVIRDLDSNIVLNQVKDTDLITTAVLEWGHMVPEIFGNSLEGSLTYDLILGADVVSRIVQVVYAGSLDYTADVVSTEFESLYRELLCCPRDTDCGSCNGLH